MLDPLDEVELWCLHRVYIPRINHSLEELRQQMNNHPVQTEHNMSPNQLFISGILTSESRTRSILKDVIDPSQFGIEEDGIPPVVNDGGAVVCNPPTIPYSLNTSQESQLVQLLEQSTTDDFGISQYLAVLRLVRSWDR